MSWLKIAFVTVAIVVAAVLIRNTLSNTSPSVSESSKRIGLTNESASLLNLNDEQTLAEVESNGVALAAHGGKAFFAVRENPSTGYRWLVDDSACNESIVKVTSDYDQPEEIYQGGRRLAGAPGTRYFTFVGQSVGECTFRMAYARSWEFDWDSKIQNNAQMISFDVSVN